MISSIRSLIAIALLLAPNLVLAQGLPALPPLAGLPRGFLGCQYNTTLPTLSNTNGSLIQCDSKGIILNDLSRIGGSALTLGQTTMSSSMPVAIASDQENIPIAPLTVTNSALVKGTTSAMTGTSSTQIIAAVTSQHIYVTNITCNNSSSTATLVTIQDGSGGTTLGTLIAPAGGGDESHGFEPLFWTTAGNGLYAADVTTGASVICTASGHSSAN